MKKNIALFSSVLILGLAALTVGDIEARAEKPLELKPETLATIDAATEKFNVDGVVYTITENTNEVTITNHITNGLAEVVSINEKVTDPNTKIQYTVTGIGTGALGLGAEEKDIVREVSIPKTILSIGESAFYKRGKLSKIKLADGIKTIGRFAFSEVSSLSEIVIPESVTSIGVGAFSGASSLEKVNLPTNITEIPKQLFQNCISLQVFNIPDTITVINESAFSGSGLTEVRIPKGIVEKSGLRAGAFETDTIRKITFTSPIPGGIYTNVFKTPQKNNALFDGWLDDDGDKYEQEDVWKLANDGNITLTATWKTDPNASNISDATILLLEETGAISFGSVATDAKMIFNDITLDGTSKTTTEQTASKIKVLDTRQNKTIGWKVGVNYKDTNYIDKKMELVLNGSSTNASIVSNSLSLDGTKKDLFTDGATKAESYEVLLNPTLTIPKDFKDTGNQKTQIEWTLEIDV